MSGKRDRIKDSERFTIITPGFTGRCYLCGSDDRVALHEAFGGTANRKKSKEWGLIYPLCGPHHNLGTFSVHNNKELDLKLKKHAEMMWIVKYTDPNVPLDDRIDKFINIFGKNYLDKEDFNVK